MVFLQDAAFLKAEFRVFTSLVLCRTLLILLLTCCCEGQSQVTGPPKPVVVMVGDDVILPCQLESASDVVSWTVEWARLDLSPRFVLVRRDRVELLLDQNPSYIGRTSVSINRLKCGDVSLKLSKVRLSDEGTYRCLIPSLDAEASVELVVGSIFSPGIEIIKNGDGVALACEANGWYPEPEVSWLDGEGRVLSAGPPETVRGPDGLYTVSSRVTVEIIHGNTFTCSLRQKKTNQTREAQIHLPDDLLMVPSCCRVRIVVSLAACVVVILTFFTVMWKWGTKTNHEDKTGQRRHRRRTEELSLVRGDEDHERNVRENEQIKNPNMEKEKLDEDSERNEEELTHVVEVIETLEKQKQYLKNHQKQLNSLLQDVIRELERNKTKLKDIGMLKNPYKMKNYKETIEKLETSKNKHEELLENTEQLLGTTEKMIHEMREKKGKLEHHKHHVNVNMKKLEGTA